MKITELLANKTILFFSVQTFNLEKEIIKKLESLQAKVFYYDERPSNSNFTKGIIRLKRSVYQKKIDKYYQTILDHTSDLHFDYLFVNRGEVVPAFFLEKFKLTHPNTIFIFYTWDSFTNHNHPTTILQYFDRKFTFDSDDAQKFNIGFRPLFFLDSYHKMGAKSNDIIYDLLFLGTAHSDRYTISNKIKEWCYSKQLKAYCYYYMQGKLVYFYKKNFDKTFKTFDYKKLSFDSLNTNQINDLYKKSNVILDINHPGQKGLTMRTFEALGMEKKMITTNSEIKKYNFYNPNNILVIDRNNILLDTNFFKNKYHPIDENLYKKTSMEGWLQSVFIDGEHENWMK